MKNTLFYFFRLFEKSILKQQYAQNAAKGVKIDILELQNLLRPNHGWQKVKKVDLNVPFFFTLSIFES